MADATNEAPGLAALSLCESLILALTETRVLDRHEAKGVLEDALMAHANAAPDAGDPEIHRAAAHLIARVREGVASALEGEPDRAPSPARRGRARKTT